MEVFINVQKFKLLLENIFDGHIIINEFHVNKLIKFLEDRNENSPGKRIIESPWFSDLIYHSFKRCKDSSVLVKVFLVKILTMLFKNELHYSKMLMQGGQNIASTMSSKNGGATTSLHEAGINVALAQISHFSGACLTTELKVWQKVLNATIHKRPIQISKVTYAFMAKLVWKLNEYNIEASLQEVLGYMLEPILASRYLTVPVLDTETDTALADDIFSYLSALLAVLIDADNKSSYDVNNVISVLQYFKFGIVIGQICNTTRNQNLIKLLNACIFRFYLQKYRHLLCSKRTNDFCIKMTVFYRNHLDIFLRKRNAHALVDFVIQSNIIRSNFEKIHAREFEFPLQFQNNDKIYDFSVQIIAHLIVILIRHPSNETFKELLETTDLIESFVVKMTNCLTDYIHVSCDLFSKILHEGGLYVKRQITTYALKELLRLKGRITKSQAGPLFQSLYYLLEAYISSDGSELFINDSILDLEDLNVLSYVLDAINMLLKSHNIPWYENVEIINIQAVALNLLKQNFLTMKQVTQVLDLINICINKFLSPNMSLLIEIKHTQDSTLNEIGDVMIRYMQHEDWEVRESAFNLLHSCTEISFIKYTPLQSVIRENSLVVLAAKAALTDPEYYSQCTALKCLTAAAKIDSMWQSVVVDNPVIFLQLVYLLRNHGEGMVRKEVANVLTDMYVNQKIANCSKKNLYEVMQTVALDDLEWEVQLAALNFWRKALHNHLTERGMIDGKFPPVTFSKEKRKIVILDDLEIKRQLTRIMDYLSKIGCLTVLLACMDDSYNIEVMKQAYSIADELLVILNKYKYEKTTISTEIVPIETLLNFMDEEVILPIHSLHITSEEEKYSVIDRILDAKRSDLIISLHSNLSRVQKTEMDVDTIYCPRREIVNPDKFIDSFQNNDYSLMIENKKNFNEDRTSNFDAMLNEILETQKSIL